MKLQYRLLGLTVLVAVFAGSANAQIAFSSFDTGDTFVTNVGATVSGPASSPGWIRQYMQFEAGESGIVDTVRFAHWRASGPDDSMRMTFYADNNNEVGDFYYFTSGSYTNASPEITTLVNPFDSVVITAGQKYWVGLYTFENVWHAWNHATANVPLGRAAWSPDGGTTINYSNNVTLSAFEVTVRPVPEPVTVLGLACGIAPLMLRRRKRSEG